MGRQHPSLDGGGLVRKEFCFAARPWGYLSALLSAWGCLSTAAGALAPSQGVVLAICRQARGCRRRGHPHRRHRRKFERFCVDFRRWRYQRRR
jgi:hypothetical protein